MPAHLAMLSTGRLVVLALVKTPNTLTRKDNLATLVGTHSRLTPASFLIAIVRGIQELWSCR